MAQDARIGSELAGYLIESEIGRGGMSVVYLAEHLRLKRRVALKLISSDLAQNPSFRDRFIRESQLAASLEHPNIVPIHDAGEADGVLYIAMRYVRGTDLKSLVRAEGPLAVARVVSILTQAASALDAAHAEALVHRDVKPGNILLTSDHHVYLSDFGLTKRTTSDSGLTATGQFVGPLDYAAPEQFEGKPLDARTDVYSLGCVLYECLTGEPPFKAENEAALVYAHLLRAPPKPTELRPALPAGLDDVVATAMAKRPDERYDSAGALAVAAQHEAGDAATVQPGPRGFEAPRKMSVRRPSSTWAALGAVGAVVVLAVALFIFTRSKTPASQPSTPPAAARSNAVWRVDPSTGRVISTIGVGAGPGTVVLGEGSVWVANTSADTVSRIDQASSQVTTIEVGGHPSGVVVGAGSAWVILPSEKGVVRIDAATNRPGAPIPLASQPRGITFGDGAVWVVNDDGLIKIEPETGRVGDPMPVPQLGNPSGPRGGIGPIVVSNGTAWLTEQLDVVRLDVSTGRADVVTPAQSLYCDVAAGAGAIWALACAGPSEGGVGFGTADVYRIDPSTGRADPPIPIQNGGRFLAIGSRFAWVVGVNGSLSRIILNGGRVQPYGQVGKSIGGIAFGANAVWVTVDVA
jgi:YVTN family beta-propeller protein